MITREEKYKSVLSIIHSVVSDESDLIANLANTAAVLKEHFEFLWVGFYFVKNEVLVLGPFQGPLACTRILKGKGVCGTAWDKRETQVVKDVHEFPGHIACSALSNSEIVVPIFKNGEVVSVLDIDSEKFDNFSDVDRRFLEELCSNLAGKF